MQLYGKPTSINVRKVLWTLAELDINAELIPCGSGFAPIDTAEFRQLNPNVLVPVLQDGDFVLWESNSICRYLVRKSGHPTLLGSNLQQMAKVEQWMDWQACELNPAWRYAFMALVRQHPDFSDPAAITQSAQQWQQKLQILDAELAKTGAYICGNDFTLADIVLGLSLNRWLQTPLSDRLELPHLAAYQQRLAQRPAAQQFCFNGVA
ncbi:glutathione S-transferase family protein [Rheinheimera tilapiae]|uniref:Glutathione S-transferase family protein n=1 Tax=Rheinheimera tilapiae TaxID=875043 RepID=A0ABV6B7K9_9GAMM